MDLKPVEAALTEVGKTFRLSRLYPQTHPSVQQSLAELSAALPAVSAQGTVELRLAPAGFTVGATLLAGKNPQLQEFAVLLHALGYRALIIEPGVTADEFGALARMAATAGKSGQALGAQTRLPPLPHLRLESGARKSAATPAGPSARHEPAAHPQDSPLARRSMSEFRPNALPVEIEASRMLDMLDLAAPEEAARRLARLAGLAPDLLDQRHVAVYARIVGVLAQWSQKEGAESAPAIAAAQRGLADAVTQSGLAALVARLSEPAAAPAERDEIVRALGTLGARGVAAVADAFGAAGEEQRALLLGIVRQAGDAAVPGLAARLEAEPKGESVSAIALLLGATQSPAAAAPLLRLAHHPEAPVRAAAVRGVARLKAPEVERVVVGALRDVDPEVRVAAAGGIALFGSASVVPILLSSLSHEADVDVVRALVGALGELRDARAVPRLTDLAGGVSGLFQRHPSSVRAAAVRALASIGTPEAMSVVAGLRGDRNADIRQAAEDAFK